ncbi:MAG: hypothetical protein WBF53_13955 [Litorimonas sp.]
MSRVCVMCGGPLPAQKRGRPRKVCGPDCKKAQQARYRAENADKVKAQQARYYAENADKVKALDAALDHLSRQEVSVAEAFEAVGFPQYAEWGAEEIERLA